MIGDSGASGEGSASAAAGGSEKPGQRRKVPPGPEQPKDVLLRANQAALINRRARADIKQRLKAGELSLRDVLLHPEDIGLSKIELVALDRMRVADLLAAAPGYGKAKVEKLMDQVGISAPRRVQGLGARQREALAAVLGP